MVLVWRTALFTSTESNLGISDGRDLPFGRTREEAEMLISMKSKFAELLARVRAQDWKTIGISFAVGFVLGLIAGAR